MPGTEKLSWKAMPSLHSSGCECILATYFQVSSEGQKEPPPWFQRQGSWFCSRTRRAALFDAAVATATSTLAIGPARPHYVAPERRGALLHSCPSSRCCESKPAQTPPSSSPPILIPAHCHPGCAGGKNPKEVPGSSEADAPAQPGDHGDSTTSSQSSGHSVNPA